MNQQAIDEWYMRRCLQLAANGWKNAKPNPMVGAVIVVPAAGRGRIIGEGYHVRCGEGHAEVNAFASVSPEDEALLPEATIYVSLEPCAHYGKTPPCCDLIIRKKVSRCVVGCVDPFAQVQGRGIQRIREAGIAVTVGVLERECRWLNRRFFTFHQHQRPYVTLKWAQTANGFIDDGGRPLAISTPFTQMLVHKLRAETDAILVGHTTDEREHPMLNVRHWRGTDPKRLVLTHATTPSGLLRRCYEENVQSLLVEGGRQTLQSFIDAGLWDEIRVEISPLAVASGTEAPRVPAAATVFHTEQQEGNLIVCYRRADSW